MNRVRDVTRSRRPWPGRLRRPAAALFLCLGWLSVAVAVTAADEAEAARWMRTGEYEKAVTAARSALAGTPKTADWAILLGRGLLTLGRYPEAHAAVTNALSRWPGNLRLRWLAREVFQSNGDAKAAAAMVNEIKDLISDQPWAYREPANLLAFGQAALALGADPRQVLERVFDPVKQADPKLRDLYLARGDLALDKHDFALAAKAYQEGLAVLPDDPDFLYGLARAYAGGDRAAMVESIEAAFKVNERHVPCLLLLADHCIDAEDDAGAGEALGKVEAVNPWHPDLWSYRAVLAHLRNDLSAEAAARSSALRFWTNNPRVDHLIGLKLSQKYRFAEGEPHQRRALEFDPEYLPAKAQRASDLLRLGDEAEGWKLAREVHDEDGYDAEAFNLTTLHDAMGRWAVVTNENFVVRMEPREAAVFGARVLDLLERARATLGAKYGVVPVKPTYVEIFPNPKDFGVRTFGMPGNPGYLGVCFGRVITATSPSANTAGPTSWEAVLWHEFCHVVTLQRTRNRMPRWLSEGISVHEELEANPAWGQRMTPRYREMTLGGELTPISQLSGAFLAPKSPLHLQYAYYESALVVEFLLERRGLGAMKVLLQDLGEGTPVVQALEKGGGPMAALEKEFAAFARRRAEELAPLDWTQPAADVPTSGDAEAAVHFLESHPTNYWALLEAGRRLTEERQWARALTPLERLVTLYPGQRGADSAHPMLAAALRGLGRTNEERQALGRWAAADAEATPAFLRLMELAEEARDWPDVARNAARFLAVNPLEATPYRRLAEADEAAGDGPGAIAASRAQLLLDPADPAEVHFRLARCLGRAGDPGARRELLLALEDAPRDRAALQLLLELDRGTVTARKPGEAR